MSPGTTPAPGLSPGGAPAAHLSAARARVRRWASRRVLLDWLAAWVVRAGGAAIIVSILGILVFILVEVFPLGSAAEVELVAEGALPGAGVGALVGDEHRSHLAALGLDGRLRVLRLSDGRVVREETVVGRAGESENVLESVEQSPGGDVISAGTVDGRVVVFSLAWRVEFPEGRRVVQPEASPPRVVEVDPKRRPVGAQAARLGPRGDATVVAETADGTLTLVRRRVTENAFTGEVAESEERETSRAPAGLKRLVIDDEQKNLYGATDSGKLLWWSLEGEIGDPQVVDAGAPVTALALLLGGRSLVVGQADGSLGVWFLVRQEGGGFLLTRIRGFPPRPAAIVRIAPSPRDRGFVAADARGGLSLQHSTSERVLWTGEAPVRSPQALSFAPRADALYVSGDGHLATFRVANPHPEVSFGALFGRVWYEGYERPAYVWQSSSGTDDFEPKLSLVPLLFGTLKGTIYSLLFAVPLAVLAAMYTSQFMHPSLKRIVKPSVEIMAALPSVVLGFLAGLWLAPRIERAFPGLLTIGIVLPILTLGTGAAWESLPRRWRNRLPAGSEVLALVLSLGAGVWLSFLLGPLLERHLFGGDFPAWLLDVSGLRYDQRNAIVVGLAMGFAVIPIIFAIAEDAFSNVPRDLVSASLALGATRWQTVTRVVLPTASAGIFSAIMVGFGRAVGETMIVLMATGNTPIMDWNPFDGFRTLSANIAVEIPEAPQFGTLYRVLFLAALLLFILTFLVNTAAELIRQRLRQRYSRL